MTQLVLASASPRRLQLLQQIGIAPDAVIPADIDETPHIGEVPRHYAARLGLEKAQAVHASGQFTLAGDTVVALGRRILPKADTAEDVVTCLTQLSGRAHRVITSLALIGPDGDAQTRLSISRVKVKRLSRAEINAYVACQEGLGKAGGYAIQGRFAAFIITLSGSYSGVMGLPLFQAAQLLHGAGYRPTQQT